MLVPYNLNAYAVCNPSNCFLWTKWSPRNIAPYAWYMAKHLCILLAWHLQSWEFPVLFDCGQFRIASSPEDAHSNACRGLHNGYQLKKKTSKTNYLKLPPATNCSGYCWNSYPKNIDRITRYNFTWRVFFVCVAPRTYHINTKTIPFCGGGCGTIAKICLKNRKWGQTKSNREN